VVEKQREKHFLSNKEIEKWIEDDFERETAGATKRAEEADAAAPHDRDDITHAELTGLTCREPEKTFEEMLVAIGDSLSDLACSNDGEDGEVKDDEVTEQDKLGKDDEPGWVMGTITKTVQHQMERFWQKQMKIDELTQPEWEAASDYFSEWDMKYGPSELRVPAVVQPLTNDDAPAPPPTTLEELMDSLDIVPGISQRPQESSRPGRSHIRLRSVKPQ
jgi:hypothetical protein